MYTLETSFWWYKVLHELVEATIRTKKKVGPIRILDAGCGTGRMMEILQKYGNVTGIDYSPDAIRYAKERGLPNIVEGDLNTYTFKNEACDVIVCLDVLYHSAIKNDLAVVEKFRQALKKDGLLIINLPAFDYLKRSHDVVVHTKKRYRKASFVKDLKQVGFTVVRASYRMPHLYVIILLSKLFQKKDEQSGSESDLKEIPGWMNNLLYQFGRLENRAIRLGLGIPFGSSLFVVAKKSETA